MRILFADKFPDNWRGRIEEAGHSCRCEPELGENELPQAIADSEVLVVRSTRVNGSVFSAAANLKLVIRAGAGTNTIDKDAAKDAGIAVCNTPGRNAVAVAELAMGLILCIDRRIPDNVSDLRDGRWDKKGYSKARGIMGSTIGVLGAGAIGLALMHRARAFGMRILVLQKHGRDEATLEAFSRLGVEEVEDLQSLAADVDCLSIHLPANENTRGLINADVLKHMKPGTAVINTSRGEVIDEEALITAMNEGGIRAGLDVYQNEPGASDNAFDSLLARHPSVYGTHHIGASTSQAQDAVAEGVADVIEAFVRGELVNCVNGLS